MFDFNLKKITFLLLSMGCWLVSLDLNASELLFDPNSKVSSRDLILTSEKTNFKETGNYDEVKEFCKKLALKYPSFIRCKVMGQTAEKRQIFYLVTSKKNALSPSRVSTNKAPVVFVIAGTHSGEIDGKDASLLNLRELLENNSKDNPLNTITVVWIPVFNVDGHEHPGKFNRPNQEGPFEQGERTTARRINLNRDWILAQTPEMRAMLSLINKWDPAVTIDLHVTDGLRFRHDVSFSVSPEFGSSSELTQAAKKLLSKTISSLDQSGHRPLGFYPRLLDKEDPKAGFILDLDTPRNSHTYASIRNRIGILVEDYAWENYISRVKTCRDTLKAIFSAVALQSNDILLVEKKTDEESSSKSGTTFSLDFEVDVPSDQSRVKTLDILGYKYDILNPAPIVGGRLISYHLNMAEVWRAPFYDDVQPIKSREIELPVSGYLIPLAWSEIVKQYLDMHGISYRILKRNASEVKIQSIRVQPQDVILESLSFQGRQMTYLSGDWGADTTSIQKGSIFVPINQPKSSLIAHLLEPKGPDSLSAWGLFNTAYEVSDYLANHRAFELVRWINEDQNKIKELFGNELFNQIPQLKNEYHRKLLEEDEFRENPKARLNFWISYLPEQDSKLNLYPIFRLQTNSLK